MEAHIGEHACLKYLAHRNREFDRVRFTDIEPDLAEFAAHVLTFTPADAAFPNRRGEYSGFAVFVGDDLDEVRAAAMAHTGTQFTIYRQRNDLHQIEYHTSPDSAWRDRRPNTPRSIRKEPIMTTDREA